MELTPQLLTDEIDFRIAVRGYDRNEVDDFLERVAIAVGQLQDQLAKAVERARRAESTLADRGAEPHDADLGAAPVAQVAPEPVKEATPPPVVEAEPVLPARTAGAAKEESMSRGAAQAETDELNEELRRTLVLAQRTADTAIREANEKAELIISDAHSKAQATLDQAETDALQNREDARGRLIAEIAELESVRESLRSDVGVLERYLGHERARVRETIQVLRRLVDDPKSFQVDDEPELSGAEVPEDARADAPPAATVASAREAVTPDAPAAATQSAAPVDAPSDDAAASAPAPVAEPRKPAEDAPSAPRHEAAAPPAAPRPSATPPSSADVSRPAPAQRADDAKPGAQPSPSTPEKPTAPADKPTTPTSDKLFAGPAEDDLGRLFDTGQHTSVDWRAAGTARSDQGPHTQPVAAARFEQETDDAFLAELRKAMTDGEPLGPNASDK